MGLKFTARFTCIKITINIGNVYMYIIKICKTTLSLQVHHSSPQHIIMIRCTMTMIIYIKFVQESVVPIVYIVECEVQEVET